MVVAFTITEIKYVVVSLFFDMVLIPFCVYWLAIVICGIKLFWLCYLSSIAPKAAIPSPKSFTIFHHIYHPFTKKRVVSLCFGR